MFKLKHMLLVAASGFTMLALASFLAQVSVREQPLGTTAQVDTFKLMSTAKDLPIQAVDNAI